MTVSSPRDHPDTRPARGRGLLLPGLLLGVGLGGFLDGIVLHQILQWHHMLSSVGGSVLDVGEYPVDTVHGLRMNTLWDGFFHVTTWLFVLAGIGTLPTRLDGGPARAWASLDLWGWVLTGWGLFNLVEGIVDHHLLRIHHVMSGEHQTLADLVFLALGAILVAGGLVLVRAGRRRRRMRLTP